MASYNEATTKLNDLYSKQLESTKQGLKTAYDQSLSDQQYARDQIAPEFRRASNDLATQYERNRRNLNMQAMVNGLNTGTGSQQALALNNSYLKNYANLQGQRATALANADRAIADLKTKYQNAVAQAIADSDYKKAAAMYDAWLSFKPGSGGGYYGGSGGGSPTGGPGYGDPNAKVKPDQTKNGVVDASTQANRDAYTDAWARRQASIDAKNMSEVSPDTVSATYAPTGTSGRGTSRTKQGGR